MRSAFFRRALVILVCSPRKTIPRIAVLAFLMSFGALPVWANTLQTFKVSVSSWGFGANSPFLIDPTSSLVIDTTTGQLVSSHLTVSNGIPLRFGGQLSGANSTQLAFQRTYMSGAFDTVTITFFIRLPMGSLVGYSGGAICGDSSPCSGASSSNEDNDLQIACKSEGAAVLRSYKLLRVHLARKRKREAPPCTELRAMSAFAHLFQRRDTSGRVQKMALIDVACY